MAEKVRLLFICTHNSARSQMAEGLVRHLLDSDYEVFSAGTQPFEINPYAVRVMEEIGVDLSAHRAKGLEEFRDKTFDFVITVCDDARETCPFFPHGKMIHKGFNDPSRVQGSEEEILRAFRKSRDEIREWIEITFSDQQNEELCPKERKEFLDPKKR